MKISVDTFRGEAPRTSPRNLPINAAQIAENCRLQTGDLESWRQFLLIKTLANVGVVQTIYLLNGAWLSWNAQVDVARGVIAGDATFRIYLTSPGLYATPRWTNYALATTGIEPFPVATRALGVSAPSNAPTFVVGVDTGAPTYAPIDVLDAGDQLAASWTISSPVDGSGGGTNPMSLVTQSATEGSPLPCYALTSRNNDGLGAWMHRKFAIGLAAVVNFSCGVMFQETGGKTNKSMNVHVANGPIGDGIMVRYWDDSGLLSILSGEIWASRGGGVAASSASVPLGANIWYTLTVDIVAMDDGTQTVTAKLLQGAAVVLSCDTRGTFKMGDYCGFCVEQSDDQSNHMITYHDNIRVVALAAPYAAVNTATSYVFTFVNDLLEQSAPSPASATVLHPDGIAVTVTTPTTTPVPGDAALYGIQKKYIYRAVSGASGTAFVFVGETSLATPTFVDNLSDEAIAGNDVLESDEWDLPPAGLQGIIALPNGIMAGFVRNELCLSVAGRPHAWPVRFRYPVDTDIVAIANIDNTIVIGTKSFLYTATGNSPASYSMSKPGDPQACVSKRSMVFLPDVGVVYASPDGWMVCAGSAGQVRNASSAIFTKRQWTALTPESIVAAVHDGVLFWFSTGQAPDAGYALDAKPDGFGLIRLTFHANAVHVDPLTDAMYLVLDVSSEPVNAALPLASTAVVPNGLRIYQFDAGASDMVYRWRGRLNLTPHPITLSIAQVRALSFTNLVVRVYGGGALIYERVLTDAREFTLPALDSFDSYELELIGTSTARTAQAAEDVLELL